MRSTVVHFAVQPLHSLRKGAVGGQQVDATATPHSLRVHDENAPFEPIGDARALLPALPVTGATMVRRVQGLFWQAAGLLDDLD